MNRRANSYLLAPSTEAGISPSGSERYFGRSRSSGCYPFIKTRGGDNPYERFMENHVATKIASGRDEVIESMKHALSHRIEEWLGSDIPAEGTEDFDAWQSKLANVEEIRSYSDIKAYVENECMDLAEFLASGDWDLEQLDLMPDELPIDYVIEKGTEIAQQSLQGGSWVNIYEYRGQFFVVGETGHEVFGSAEEAFRKAGIGRETNDKISNALVSHNYRHLLA